MQNSTGSQSPCDARHVVSAVLNESPGQVFVVPLQVSGRSQNETAGRQTTPARVTPSAGQLPALQVSVASQAAVEGLQTVPLGEEPQAPAPLQVPEAHVETLAVHSWAGSKPSAMGEHVPAGPVELVPPQV